MLETVYVYTAPAGTRVRLQAPSAKKSIVMLQIEKSVDYFIVPGTVYKILNILVFLLFFYVERL